MELVTSEDIDTVKEPVEPVASEGLEETEGRVLLTLKLRIL